VNVLSGRSSHLTSVAAGGVGLTCGWEGEAVGAVLAEALDEGDADPVAFDCAPPASQAQATIKMNTIASAFDKGTFTTMPECPAWLRLRCY
jgi:hypothetical protein